MTILTTTIAAVRWLLRLRSSRVFFADAVCAAALLFFFIIGALLKEFPPPTGLPSNANPPPASKAMAAMLYLYVCFYSMGWGPLPCVFPS